MATANTTLAGLKCVLALTLCGALIGCASHTPPPTLAAPHIAPPFQPVPAPVIAPPVPPKSRPQNPFDALPGWRQGDPAQALLAFRRSCAVFARNWTAAAQWRPACARAQTVDSAGAWAFFEQNFVPQELAGGKTGNDIKEGLLTAYYEPEIPVRAHPAPGFDAPIYARPADLVTVEPKRFGASGLRTHKIMGRVADGRLVPYYTREEILRRGGKVLAWGRPVDVFFLQIQGSGKLRFDDGRIVRAAFAGHNGLPYTSIGKLLIKEGALAPGKASKAAIEQWLRQAGPQKAAQIMARNQRYVFFKLQTNADPQRGPAGTQGAPLTARVSLAVDPRLVPLGSPIWVQTRLPAHKSDWRGVPAQFLAIAQDTGGAINGAMRGDLFLGSGEAAGREAGMIKHKARWWVLKPKQAPVSALSAKTAASPRS